MASPAILLAPAQGRFNRLDGIPTDELHASVGQLTGLSLNEIPELRREFLGFLACLATSNREMQFMPSNHIDTFWHEAMRSGALYERLCEAIGFTPSHIECQPDQNWMCQTQQEVAEIIGNTNPKFWLQAAGCGGGAPRA